MKPLLLSLLFIAPLCAQTIDVTTYGAKPNGSDSTVAINNALAAAIPGSEVTFPCGANGTGYIVSQTITFPSHVTISGSHNYGCQIIYQSNSYNNTAFSLVGSNMVTIRDLGLYTSSTGIMPGAILMLGGVHGQDGQHLLDNVSIGGYANTAMVYSIGSENNVFRHNYFSLRGGSAQIGFFTAAADNLGLCGSVCQAGSNLSLTMDGPIFANSVSQAFTAIEDKTEGGTGDHVYRDGYIGLGGNPASAGFTFVSGDATHAGPNNRIAVSGFRIEQGGYGFKLLKDVQTSISNLDISNVTWSSNIAGAVGFLEGATGLTVANCRFTKNLGNNNYQGGSSTVDILQNSSVMEDYGPFNVLTSAIGNYFVMIGKGLAVLPAATLATNVVVQPNH